MQFDKEYKKEVIEQLHNLHKYVLELSDTVNSEIEPERSNNIDKAFNLISELRRTLKEI